MEVTIGGQRLGSGNKQKQEMHNYNRATFNQEQDWKSSMAPGILYPFLCIPMTNGDSMDIDLDAFVRTLPTKGPLFGSFKLQADIFSVPMRLYQGILHNNPINIGLKMNQIYLPKLIMSYKEDAPRPVGSNQYNWQINNTCLMKYLGLSGVGTYVDDTEGHPKFSRKINAIPLLAYYDIFKNYYANKQEQNAYVITPEEVEVNPNRAELETISTYPFNSFIQECDANGQPIGGTAPIFNLPENYTLQYTEEANFDRVIIELYGKNLTKQSIKINGETLEDLESANLFVVAVRNDNKQINIIIYKNWILNEGVEAIEITATEEAAYTANIKLTPFALTNIDQMRNLILGSTELGTEFQIGLSTDITSGKFWDQGEGDIGDGLPYSAVFNQTENKINFSSFAQSGLVVKTYQSDLFNNWVQTDWITGENGIAALSAVDVSEGTLEMDALNLAQKVYNMLNRVAISGGTFEDWQEAVYTQDAVRKAETPVYEGGMSAEVMFEEVISNAETNVENDFVALGSLGGKGTMIGQKGGKNIHIKANEPIFVMGIVSLTPRICYTQGNEWYLTELDTMDDLHKPALDGIGFQDLIQEQMAWWATQLTYYNTGIQIEKYSAGKVVAWSNYMTAVDKAFGDFAEPEGKGFMVLARNYEQAGSNIKDLTTYIDPAKYNYAFAYNDLAAQNFWVQIHSNVKTRRVMSAHQIPNL